MSLQVEPPQPERAHEFEDGECYPETLVELFLEEYSRPGDLVFDPFAGSGTTLVVAERLGRRPLGLEIQEERVDFIRGRLLDPSAVLRSDALRVGELGLPPVDLVMTSPPYMTSTGHPENPLTGYQTLDGDYQRYLRELTSVFDQIGRTCRPGAKIVINVANLLINGRVTTLAWDLARAVSHVLPFEREIVLDWDKPMNWCTNDYCLIFSAPGERRETRRGPAQSV